jgi:hypothetical protein
MRSIIFVFIITIYTFFSTISNFIFLSYFYKKIILKFNTIFIYQLVWNVIITQYSPFLSSAESFGI